MSNSLNNRYSPVPFYETLAEQNLNENWVHNDFALFYPNDQIPSLNIVRTQGVGQNVTRLDLVSKSDGSITDILQLTDTKGRATLGTFSGLLGYDVVKFDGSNALNLNLPNGGYYLHFEDGINTLYSEVFNWVGSDIISKCVLVEFGHIGNNNIFKLPSQNVDTGVGLKYRPPAYTRLYLMSDISAPQIRYKETRLENRDDFKLQEISITEHNFKVLIPKFLVIASQVIQMHDTVQVTYKDYTFKCSEFSMENIAWQFGQSVAAVDFVFEEKNTRVVVNADASITDAYEAPSAQITLNVAADDSEQLTTGVSLDFSTSTVESVPISASSKIRHNVKIGATTYFTIDYDYGDNLSKALTNISTSLTAFQNEILSAFTVTASGVIVADHINGLHAIFVRAGIIPASIYNAAAVNFGYDRTIETQIVFGSSVSAVNVLQVANLYAPILFSHGTGTFDAFSISDRHAVVWGDGTAELLTGDTSTHVYVSPSSGYFWGISNTQTFQVPSSNLTSLDLSRVNGSTFNLNVSNNNLTSLVMPNSGSYDTINISDNALLTGALDLSTMNQKNLSSIEFQDTSISSIEYGIGGTVTKLNGSDADLSGPFILPFLEDCDLRLSSNLITSLVYLSTAGQSISFWNTSTNRFTNREIPSQVAVNAGSFYDISNRLTTFVLPSGSNLSGSVYLNSQTAGTGLLNIDFTNVTINVLELRLSSLDGAANSVILGAPNSVTVTIRLWLNNNNFSANGLSIAALVWQPSLQIRVYRCSLSSAQQEAILDEWIATGTAAGGLTGTGSLHLGDGGNNAALSASAIAKANQLINAGWTVLYN